jgi:hypothetical protein
MQSLATEYLLEIESLAGPERQHKEDIVTNTLGSMFFGKASCSWMRFIHGTYQRNSS